MPKHESKINFAYQKAVSYSQYSIYKQCPHQWYLNYVKKHKVFKPSIHLIFGTSFHETLQKYISVLFEESVKKADSLDLPSYLKERMIENYRQGIEDNKGEHFIKKEDFNSFVEDGCNILEWFKKNRARYISTKGTKLVGIEIPIEQYITEEIPNVIMIGSIDVIFYHKATDSYTIIDIKTSTKGWNAEDKKDKLKISQILLYKHFYSRALKIDPSKISVMFLVVKRRPFITEDFPTKWVQEVIPSQGTRKLKEAVIEFEEFVKDCFTKDAKYQSEKEYPKNFDSCKYCPFKENEELCKKS